MKTFEAGELDEYINCAIEKLQNNMTNNIHKMNLNSLLNGNLYLLATKTKNGASKIIDDRMMLFLSSSEEKLFGDFLEDLAIHIASITTGGHKSTAQGMDLEFEHDGTYYVISIKSGPNWGNSSQHARLASDFANAEIRLRQSTHRQNIQKVLGICYGKTKTAYSPKGYLKVVGQNFWTLISEDKDLYINIIEPLGYRAREHNENYHLERDRISNVLIKEFINRFCSSNGDIDWSKLIRANSGNYDLDEFFPAH